jgi:hypothetical protein
MPFALPTDLAAACFARLGAEPPADVAGAAALLDRLASTLPTGSTAKLEAVEQGRVPPGADPAAVAEQWLARPELSWSCWAVSTLYVALVTAGGALDAEVLAVRRIDPSTAPVDFHSVVELRDGARRWVTDPYFWTPPIGEPGGDAIRCGLWAEAFVDGAVWRTSVGTCAGRGIVRYRSLTGPLDAGDVDAFCRVSVTHSGVASRPRAHLATPDGSVAATLDRDGRARFRRWRAAPGRVWDATCETVELDGWEEAAARLVAAARSR